MFDILKLGLLTWVTLFVIFFIFISFVLFVIFSLWWLITNNMVDRSTFLLISGGVSLILSLYTLWGSQTKK